MGSCYCVFFACLFRELGIVNLILNVLTTCKPSKLEDFGDLPLITLNIIVEWYARHLPPNKRKEFSTGCRTLDWTLRCFKLNREIRSHLKRKADEIKWNYRFILNLSLNPLRPSFLTIFLCQINCNSKIWSSKWN